MKTSRILKLVSINVVLLLTQACSHPIEIEGKGDVTSTSTRGCTYDESITVPLPDRCAKNLVIGEYKETYSPAAQSGWYFDHWVNYCTTVTSSPYECPFNVPAATVKTFWGQTMRPLKAVFVTQCGDGIVAGIEQCDGSDGCTATCTETPDTDGDGVPDLTDNCDAVDNTNQADFNNDDEGDACDDTDGDGNFDISDACPLNPNNPCTLITGNDIVTRIGKQWAKPDLFTSITWDEMNTACPDGACKDGEVLKGKDLTGWTWAGFRDVALLYNSFGASLSTDVPGGQNVANSTWAPAVYAAGFRPTLSDSTFRTIYFMLPVDVAGGITAGAYAGSQDYFDPESYDYAGTNTGINLTYGEYSGCGFLLYRTIQ